MRIGIDAKWFFEGPVSGRLVVSHLVKELTAMTTDHEFCLFLDKNSKEVQFAPRGPRVHVKYVWGENTLLSNVFSLPWSMRGEELDVILYQNFVSPFGAGKRIAFIYDVLFESHPQHFTSIERKYFWPLKFLTRFADLVCTISETEKRRILSYGYKSNPDQVAVIPLGVDRRFRARPYHEPERLATVKARYGLPDQLVLFVGRLTARKNLANLLRALRSMETRSIPLVLVGAQDRTATGLEDLLGELEHSGRVKLLGPVPDEDLPSVYALATLFCYPSFGEGFGLPALEAMASGVPVVVSQGTSLEEVCGEAGNYIDPGDHLQIARMLDTLLENQDLYRLKREAGLKRAKVFTWRASAERLLESMERICQKRDGKR